MAEVNRDVPETNRHSSASPHLSSNSTLTTRPNHHLKLHNSPHLLPRQQPQQASKRCPPNPHALVCAAYQERVPLQLLNFAYKHSSSILANTLYLFSNAYVSQQTRARDNPGGGLTEANGQVSEYGHVSDFKSVGVSIQRA